MSMLVTKSDVSTENVKTIILSPFLILTRQGPHLNSSSKWVGEPDYIVTYLDIFGMGLFLILGLRYVLWNLK